MSGIHSSSSSAEAPCHWNALLITSSKTICTYNTASPSYTLEQHSFTDGQMLEHTLWEPTKLAHSQTSGPLPISPRTLRASLPYTSRYLSRAHSSCSSADGQVLRVV
jgi:hypothetical protein